MKFHSKAARLGIALALLLAGNEVAAQALFSGPGLTERQGFSAGAADRAQTASRGGTLSQRSSAVVRARTAAIDMPLLSAAGIDALTAAPSTSLVLNLFDDVVMVAMGERVETDAWGHRSWIGRVDGVPLSTVTLTWRADTVVGTVHAGAAVYRIEAARGIATIAEIDPARAGAALEPLQPPAVSAPAGTDRLRSGPGVGRRADAEGATAAADEPGVVDVFVYYTPAAAHRLGGPAAVAALVAKAIADTNTAFVRSGVEGSVRLVGSMQATGYVEDSFSLETDLRNLTFSPEVAVTRNASGADLVALLVAEKASDSCGIGWLGPSADFGFSVSAVECLADGQWTFTHELAHNFGSHHNRENAFGTPYRPYSYGHIDKTAGFRTVMSYPGPCDGCPRILNYSTPARTYSGKPTGTPLADNARSLSEAFFKVTAFRDASAGPPGPPENVRGTVSGWTSEISWEPPVTGGSVTTYIGQAGSAPGGTDLFNGAVGLSTRIVVTTRPGLYYARILAQNASGTSTPSNEIALTVGASCTTPPAPVVASRVDGRVARVTWGSSPGADVVGYTVLVGSRPGASDVYRLPVGRATEISGTLQPGIYYVRVAAQSSCGAATTSDDIVLHVF